jgi:anti-sigma factor RsiW
MSRHLSSEQLSRWAMGERSSQDEQHLRDCPLCGAEVARFDATLAHFRGSLRDWSQTASAGTKPIAIPPEHRAPWRLWTLRGMALAAALLIAAWIPVHHAWQHPNGGSTGSAFDAQLLEEVDAGVSRTVPQSMEPLLQLVAWDSNSGTGVTEKDNNHATQQQK